MNTNTANVRKSSVAVLARDYESSSPAISLVLRTLEKDNIDNLSPSGIINSLYFLSSTDPIAWERQQQTLGKQIISTIESLNPGSQTRQSLNAFKDKLQKVEMNLQP